MAKSRYHYCCVSPGDLDELQHIVDTGREIKRETFVRHVDREDLEMLERSLGYGSHLKMKDDWHFSYHKASYKGKKIYYFCQSAIEYVFK